MNHSNPLQMKQVFKFFNLPTAKLITALVLLASGIFELSESAFEKFFNIDIRIHHGVIIFGVTKLFGAIAEILESSETISTARKKHRSQKK